MWFRTIRIPTFHGHSMHQLIRSLALTRYVWALFYTIEAQIATLDLDMVLIILYKNNFFDKLLAYSPFSGRRWKMIILIFYWLLLRSAKTFPDVLHSPALSRFLCSFLKEIETNFVFLVHNIFSTNKFIRCHYAYY